MRQQLKVMQKQLGLTTSENKEKKDWADKHDRARALVLKTGKQLPGVGWGYERVFWHDEILRHQIETYIVDKDLTARPPRLKPRDIEPDQLLLPAVQRVIQQTIDTVERFKREHPEESAKLGL